MLGNHVQTLRMVMEALRGLIGSFMHLGNRLDQVCTQLSAATSGASPSPPQAAPLPAPVDVPPSPHEPFIPIPARYSGELGQCGQFLYPVSWSTHLPWVEYAYDSLVSSATGMSPFMVTKGFHLPLFPEQEADVLVLSNQDHMQWCRLVWRAARTDSSALLHGTSIWWTDTAHQYMSTPWVRECGSRPRNLRSRQTPKNWHPGIVALFDTVRMINPAVTCLNFRHLFKVHPSFHVSLPA